MPKLTGNQKVQLTDALSQAFDRREFDELVLQAFNDRVANLAAPGPHRSEVLDVIGWSERQSITLRLIAKAMELRPHNGELQAVAGPLKQLLISEVVSAFDPAHAPAEFQVNLQRIIRPELAFADVALWRERMENAERKICRVELTQGTGEGTGFLVAKDLVLTSRHVIESLLPASVTPERISDVVLRFDYKMNPDRTPMNDREYRLSPNWLAASDDTLDYALLRVEGDPGNESVGTAERPSPRGWLKLSSSKPAAGHPIQILQHPRTLPLKLVFGIVLPNSPADFLWYNANTDGGSSGSPVATGAWDIVALHRQGEANHNAGTCCRSILKNLEEQHLSALLG